MAFFAPTSDSTVRSINSSRACTSTWGIRRRRFGTTVNTGACSASTHEPPGRSQGEFRRPQAGGCPMTTPTLATAPTGIDGLDEITSGGLPRG